MKRQPHSSIFLALIALLVFGMSFTPAGAASETGGQAGPRMQAGTPLPEEPAGSSERPLIVVETYSIDPVYVTPGQDFTLNVRFVNAGSEQANNVVVTYNSENFMPLETGGVVALGPIDSGSKRKMDQRFSAAWALLGSTNAVLSMQITYTGGGGESYTENFTLTLPVTPPAAQAATNTPTPTPTAAPKERPQLVISAYEVDLPILQPGSHFSIALEVTNVGDADARRVTMILGGGSSSAGGTAGTPEPGGVSGASGDFGTFAPVAASNVQFLGDLPVGGSLQASSSLIVNASANPGVYPMRISFTYSTGDGSTYTDDQVITMLVYSPPMVEVNFYRPPDPLFAGMGGSIPLQVTNLGRKAATLGNMTVTAEGADVMNNSIVIGMLDISYPFTFDPMVIPYQPGPLEIQVKINYTDDFNQQQTIEKVLTLDVMEAPVMEPPPEGEGGMVEPMPMPEPETFWQKVMRFVRGLLGLDSSQSQPGPGDMPPMEPGMPEPIG